MNVAKSLMNVLKSDFTPFILLVGQNLTSGPALTLLGSKLLDEGKFLDAVTVFRRAATLFPAVPLVASQMLYAIDVISRHTYDFNSLIIMMAQAWHNLGVAGSRLGDLSLAIEAYTRAAELEPKDVGNIFRIASITAR
jgi:Flp pilus assembly protein TadD